MKTPSLLAPGDKWIMLGVGLASGTAICTFSPPFLLPFSLLIPDPANISWKSFIVVESIMYTGFSRRLSGKMESKCAFKAKKIFSNTMLSRLAFASDSVLRAGKYFKSQLFNFPSRACMPEINSLRESQWPQQEKIIVIRCAQVLNRLQQ